MWMVLEKSKKKKKKGGPQGSQSNINNLIKPSEEKYCLKTRAGKTDYSLL